MRSIRILSRGVLFVALLFAVVTFLAQAQVATVAPTLRGARVGFYAVDLNTGATLVNRNAGADFMPASTLKLIAGSMALDRFPPDFAFVTRILYDGSIRDGVLHGNLYVEGGGDPTFDDAALHDAATAIAASGIRQIVGFIALDSSRYTGPRYPPGWSIDDLPYDYNAPVTALSLDDNAAHLVLVPGASAGDPVKVMPTSAAVFLRDALVTGAPGSPDTSDAVRNVNDATLDLIGSIPAGRADGSLDLAVQSPAAFFCSRLRAALSEANISSHRRFLRAQPPVAAHVIWTHRSPSLAVLLPKFWLPSNNFYGEMFVNEFGARTNGIGTTLDRGLAAEHAWLISLGIDPATLTLADGSGLSEYDRVTPRALVAILQHDWNGTHRQAVLDALPQAGVRGTLIDTFANTPLRHVLIAKTGSMNHTHTLAGYILTPTRSIAFALLVNDWMDRGTGASERLDDARARLLETLL